MTAITRFEIKNLHGRRNIDLRFKDNTLILIGENGSGKTTILRLLYYLLSGQWSSMVKYTFDEIAITIDDTRYSLHYPDLAKSLGAINQHFLHRLPTPIRRRVLQLLEEHEGRLVPSELEHLCVRYGIPLDLVLDELEPYLNPKTRTKAAQATLNAIRDTLHSQLLYLPTYRRIEQELNLIFKGLDEHEFRHRLDMLSSHRTNDTCVELVEFGMKDVESAISITLHELNAFARETLTTLTFSYLDDVLEGQYTHVNLKSITEAPDAKVRSILDRIQEHMLSRQNKQHLQEIIRQVKLTKKVDSDHQRIVCHYFTKLMAFQATLEAKESQITRFCSVCNQYMEDKEFVYDNSKYDLIIQSRLPAKRKGKTRAIQLQHLSSGEKQIISLFSHIYLSGGRSYFVLIDEPELSLSVPWQRRFLLDIRDAELCKGIIAATHSPFIYDNNLHKYARGLGEFMS